jgi:hypothetical protein
MKIVLSAFDRLKGKLLRIKSILVITCQKKIINVTSHPSSAQPPIVNAKRENKKQNSVRFHVSSCPPFYTHPNNLPFLKTHLRKSTFSQVKGARARGRKITAAAAMQ